MRLVCYISIYLVTYYYNDWRIFQVNLSDTVW